MATKGRPRLGGVTRTEGGRISRAKTPGRFLVYLLYVQSKSMFKIGYTGNMKARITQYQVSTGCRPIIIAEFTTENAHDARAVEAIALAEVNRRGFEIFAREWVVAELQEAPDLVSIIRKAGEGFVLEAGGMGIHARDKFTEFDYQARKARAATLRHRGSIQ